jgi:hypothetical protein
LANLGHPVSDQTVGNILRRHGIAPVPERSKTTTWRDFIRRHMDVLAGADFFTGRGADLARLVTYYVLFFHSLGEPEGLHCWHHRSSGGVLDASGSLQRDLGGDGTSQRLSLRVARSRCQVLR